jgi:ABC-type transport system involved in cytochrome c biogenesis permease subunit
VLGLLIHIIGLVDRIIISGRPPVTNLYSSAIFVSAVMVILMMIVERITKLGIANFMAGLGAFLALLWAWSMTIVDGDTFTVMVAVLDTQFWLATHVVCISIGYSATFGAGLLGLAYLIGLLITPAFATKESRRQFSNVIYGVVCFGLLCSFFGTVLGGLWGDDSWGRFWGWDPKENGALMIVLWNAVVLHARWGGIVKDRGLAALAILGNVVVLWSWKGVNALGVGLHAYAGTEDTTLMAMLLIGAAHVGIACLVVIPMRFWMSFAKDPTNRLQN